MFRSTKTFALLAAHLAASLTASLTAQELEARIVSNPNNTVTYTIDIDGPPRGSAMLFGGYGLLPQPLLLPGIGNLFLDPSFSLRIMPVPLNPNGQGNAQLQVRKDLVNGDVHYFQALVNDGGILRFTNWSSTLFQQVPLGLANNANLTTVLWHNSKKQTYKGEFRGKPGSHVEIVHYRGGQIDIWQGIIPANGRLPVCWNYKHAQKHGDVIEIRMNGTRVKSWRR